ncbi:MAG: hypothetical protein LUE24_13885 [Lachnospiraceae bacterium]|nr:hypothetical protein [Lachnospiraceae bacterium]
MVEVKMIDGEKLRMDAANYAVDKDARILKVKTYDRSGNEYNDIFNFNHVVYVGSEEKLHSGEGEDD